MNIFENFKSAIFNILSNKMRLFLTTLGIIIGITSVVIITAIGRGFENDISKTLGEIDAGLMNVSPSYSKTIREKDKLTLKDLNKIKKIPNVNYVTSKMSKNMSVTLKNPNEKKGVLMSGVTEDAKNVYKLKMKYGRFLTEKEAETNSKVCIIDNNLARDIFGREDAIGEEITLENVMEKGQRLKLEVIGIFSKDSNELYTPTVYTSAKAYMELDGNVNGKFESIALTIEDANLFYKTGDRVEKSIQIITGSKEEKYYASGGVEILKSTNGTIKIFTVFVGLVASISLLVGGIGVMNIMLVTVTERTKEIGIRKALGATNGNIKMQFLIESLMVAVLGGTFGIIFGYVGSFIAGKVLSVVGSKIVPEVSIPVVIGSVIISSVIGIVFGVYPAGKAAKLDPIDALRYE